MNWQDIVKQLDEKIKVGDTVKTKKGGLLGSTVTLRRGEITEIKIAMEKNDIAGENASAVSVQEYDLSLGYQGTISYKDETAKDEYWAYLDQIYEVVK
jgi:hypothetical protein|tara:strand:+ start:969 stop:1262 length:294 start_codon:yes stop_codon:yes gene_type:complete